MSDGARGGSIVSTSSTQGIRRWAPTAQAHGRTQPPRALVARIQGWATQLAAHSIRVNAIHSSSSVATDMILDDAAMKLVAAEDPWIVSQQNALLQPDDIAAAVAWLVSHADQFITGTSWPLDAGFTLRNRPVPNNPIPQSTGVRFGACAPRSSSIS
jgi:NAD(P)-dependent dehydrogenase (short-subunit alcohol dehydrogenase family)